MTTRPALPILKPGDKVLLRRSPNDMRGRPDTDRYLPARVVKAARVWLTIKPDDSPREYRMRRDTQDQATEYYGFDWSFVTPEQHEYDGRMRAVDMVIRDAGVQLDRWVSWTPEQRIALADLIISLDILNKEGNEER